MTLSEPSQANPLSEVQAQDLLEIIDDRYKRTSTALASQVPVANWHERFSSPTLSDAIMDRLVEKTKILDSFRPQGHIMNPQRRFAPNGGLFKPESVAGLARIRSSLKPHRPKELLEAVLRQARVHRSASLYNKLSSTVSLNRCVDPAFIELKSALQTWFPCGDILSQGSPS